MPKEEEELDPQDLHLLKKELEASLQRIRFLEKENKQLRQELAFLKGQSTERKSSQWKKLQSSITNEGQPPVKAILQTKFQEQPALSFRKYDSSETSVVKERSPRTPNPPPRPSLASRAAQQSVIGTKAPPPPPPPPLKQRNGLASMVRRVPEVVELYRLLTRRDPRAESRYVGAGIPIGDSARNMIGEIENRSAYLLGIKSDVETQGEFIDFLTREVEGADYKEISDLEAFVKWLDDELSYLVDERAVLKHFPRWPERKADAMREAAFSYRDLKNLETEALTFQDNPHMPLPLALKRMQALQDKLEGSFHKVERMRESASKRYREFHIPWDWMLDNGMLGQLKLCSVRLARDYMKRIAGELQSNPCTQEEEDLLLQGVRFAFRVHQFVGGFDAETMRAFEVLAKTGRSYLAKSL